MDYDVVILGEDCAGSVEVAELEIEVGYHGLRTAGVQMGGRAGDVPGVGLLDREFPERLPFGRNARELERNSG